MRLSGKEREEMTIDIKEMSESDLKQKIENIKAEREKTADALKRYEEELERRKKEVPLGVPLANTLMELPYDAVSRAFLMWFQSKEASDKFENGYLSNFVKALQNIAEGKPIEVKALLPLMKKGYVAMDADRTWCWFSAKPELYSNDGIWNLQARSNSIMVVVNAFNIKPAEDWTKSLQECGL